jgi:hypothetical protein
MSTRGRDPAVESQPPIGCEEQRLPRSESSEAPRGRAIAIFDGLHTRNGRCVAPQVRPIPIRSLRGGCVEEHHRRDATPIHSHDLRQFANGRAGTGAPWVRKYQQGRAVAQGRHPRIRGPHWRGRGRPSRSIGILQQLVDSETHCRRPDCENGRQRGGSSQAMIRTRRLHSCLIGQVRRSMRQSPLSAIKTPAFRPVGKLKLNVARCSRVGRTPGSAAGSAAGPLAGLAV